MTRIPVTQDKNCTSCRKMPGSDLTLDAIVEIVLRRLTEGLRAETDVLLRPMYEQLEKVSQRQDQQACCLETVVHQIRTLESLEEMIKQSVTMNRSLSQQHFENHVIMPMVRSVVSVVDLVSEGRAVWEKDDNSQFMDFVQAVETHLIQFLATYDVRLIRHKQLTPFNPRIMKPLKTVPTNFSKADKCVAQSLQMGIRLGKDRLLRHESVSVYQLQTETVKP